MQMRRTLPRETDEQAILVDWMRAQGIGFFSVPNGAILGGRNKWGLYNRLKREGLLPGAPDLVLIDLAPDFHKPVCVEMKRRKNGKLSKMQEAVLSVLEQAGWIVIVAHGAGEAISELVRLGY